MKKKMNDAEKIELMKDMVTNYWEGVNVSEDSALALISAITTVIDFEGKDEKNAEN